MKKRSSLLWEIYDANAGSSSYLYGTMHVRDRKAFSFIEKIKPLIASCEVFATEIDLATDQVVIPPLLLKIPEEQTIASIIGSKKYAKLRRIILKAFHLDLDHYQRLIPLLTINEITSQILSDDQHLPLDAYLSQYAKTMDRKMTGIETLDEHLKVLQKIPLEYQIKSLLKMGGNVSRFRKQILHWADLYEAGELQQLYLSSKKSLGKMKRILLYDRNIIMADRIDHILQEHTLFCAVGAAHLPGEKGVLRLLKQKGYGVRAKFLETVVNEQ